MERDFKGVWIPAEVWLDERLSALEKMIYAEIDSLDINNEGCFAKNEYLAQFCQCSITKVSNAISHLKELGYIIVEGFDGRGRKIRVTLQNLQGSLTKNVRQGYKICKADLQNLQGTPPDTLYENTIRDNYKSIKGFRPPALEEVKAYCEERNNNIDPAAFIDYYTANGWKVGGRSQMKDWRAAVRQWERNDIQAGRKKTPKPMDNKSYDLEEVEKFW